MSTAREASMTSNTGIVDPAEYRGKVLAISVLGYAFDGMDVVVFALALPLLFKAWPGFNLMQAGVIGTAMLVGMSLGGYIFGPLADKYGRKRVLVWCIAFFGLVTGVSGFTQNYIQLAALRLLAGLGLGAEWALSGTLLQEFSDSTQRGKMSSVMMIGWPIGYGVTVLISYFLTPIFGWPILYWTGATAVLLALYIYIAIPESPMWLQHHEEKKKGVNTNTTAVEVGFGDLMKKEHIRSFIWSIVICASLMITYWAVTSWLPTVMSKEKNMNAKLYSTFLIAFQIMCAVGFMIGAYCGDRFGKRKIMTLFSFLSAVTFFVWLYPSWSDMMFLILGSLNSICASVVWGILSAYLVEQFPTNIRVVAVATGYSTGRLISTIVPVGMGAIAMKVGLVTVISATSVFYIICMAGVLMLSDSRKHI